MGLKTSLLGAVVGALVCAPGALAWPGFNWDDWKAVTESVKPDIKSPQAGVPTLLPLLKNTPDAPRNFPAVTAWTAKRTTVQDSLRAMIGVPGRTPWDREPAEVLGEEILEHYVRQHLSIPGEEGDRIPAYMLVPKRVVARPCPVMIVLHQTQAAGKREACGMEGDPEMAFADELAKRGYMCLVPDAIGFGERIPEGGQPYDGAMALYEAHPQWSYFGKMTWEVSRLVDYLSRRGDLDIQRVGIIGHSHGGYGAIISAAVEPRIALAVASCGLTTFRTDPTPERWSHLTPLMPLLGLYLDDIGQTPTDWHEIAACIAPRPFFNFSALDDKIFPNTAPLADVYKQLEDLYGLFNMPNRFHGELAPGEHSFPKEVRERAYDWIDQQFKIVRK